MLDELKTWISEQATLKTLSIGKAAAYVVANWERLTRFVEDPRIPLDNNSTNAVHGIGGTMPRRGICRIGGSRASNIDGILDRERARQRHSHRLWRKASRLSDGRNRGGVVPEGSAWPRARSFSRMSA